MDSEYDPVNTRLEAESTVHPSDCQPAGSEADGAAEDEEEDREEVVEVVAEGEVVGGVVEVALAELEVADGEAEEAGARGARASFWKMEIRYPPPQIVPGSPPHLDVQPSLAGTKFALSPHQHSWPYSTPA